MFPGSKGSINGESAKVQALIKLFSVRPVLLGN